MTEEMAAKTNALIEKVDKESATRKFTGKIKSFFYIFAILVSLYHLYTAIFGPPVTLVHRSLHVAMMCSMCFLMYPMRKKSSRTKPSWFDWFLAAISFVIPFYIWHDYLGVVERAGRASDMDMVMATLLVALVLEATLFQDSDAVYTGTFQKGGKEQTVEMKEKRTKEPDQAANKDMVTNVKAVYRP